MARLPVGQNPIVMPHYPHMMAEDIEVWSKYLAAPIAPIKKVWYDVHVGGAVPVPAGGGEMLQRISAGLTRKRIDVIAQVGGGFWVVEIKPFASMLALGQVISYTRLFLQEYSVDGEVWPVIVCDAVDDDLLAGYDALGVAVVVNG